MFLRIFRGYEGTWNETNKMLFQPLWSSDLEQYLFQQHGERATGEKTQQLETHMSLFNMVELDFEASQYLF